MTQEVGQERKPLTLIPLSEYSDNQLDKAWCDNHAGMTPDYQGKQNREEWIEENCPDVDEQTEALLGGIDEETWEQLTDEERRLLAKYGVPYVIELVGSEVVARSPRILALFGGVLAEAILEAKGLPPEEREKFGIKS